ncbi:MAG: TasA family protein [Anaeromassilibacillus sp.]
MDKTKRHLVLSIVSFLLVLTLLGGTTFAWYMDAERVGSNFQAGVLDVGLSAEHPEGTVPLNFTNLRPLTIAQFRDEFQMDENGVITNKNQDGFDGIPLYFFQVNVENQGSLPMRVTLAVREQKKGNDPDLPYGDTIPNLVDNGSGGVTVDEDEPNLCAGAVYPAVLGGRDGDATLQPIDNGAGDGTSTYRDLWKDGVSDYARKPK